jgi:hypothetical protein
MDRHRYGHRGPALTVSAVALVAALGLAGCAAGAGSLASASATALAGGASAVPASPAATDTARTGATTATPVSASAGTAQTGIASTTGSSGTAQATTTGSSATASASSGEQGSAVSSPFFNFKMPGGWTFDGLSTGGQGGGLAEAQWTSADTRSHLAVTASRTSYADQLALLRGRGPWTTGPSSLQVGPLRGQVATLLSDRSDTTSVARAIFDTGGSAGGLVGSLTVDLTTTATGSQRALALQQFQTALQSLSLP